MSAEERDALLAEYRRLSRIGLEPIPPHRSNRVSVSTILFVGIYGGLLTGGVSIMTKHGASADVLLVLVVIAATTACVHVWIARHRSTKLENKAARGEAVQWFDTSYRLSPSELEHKRSAIRSVARRLFAMGVCPECADESIEFKNGIRRCTSCPSGYRDVLDADSDWPEHVLRLAVILDPYGADGSHSNPRGSVVLFVPDAPDTLHYEDIEIEDWGPQHGAFWLLPFVPYQEAEEFAEALKVQFQERGVEVWIGRWVDD
ncbi:MAG: hypothetical protein AAFS11_03280 [Planctomycetota bacterium]